MVHILFCFNPNSSVAFVMTVHATADGAQAALDKARAETAAGGPKFTYEVRPFKVED